MELAVLFSVKVRLEQFWNTACHAPAAAATPAALHELSCIMKVVVLFWFCCLRWGTCVDSGLSTTYFFTKFSPFTAVS